MAMTKEVKDAMSASVLCWLATANSKGDPNVSPKEMFLPGEGNIFLIANIASPQSVQNIRENAAVCICFIDIFRQKGYQLKGIARVVERNDEAFEDHFERFQPLVTDRYPVLSIIEIEVTSAKPVIAPSYTLFPDTTEDDQIDQALVSYGLK
ncbi:pyridoxamine 5'-phosphate oxidase family protein [Parasalinivibrio latis]|uniref:pyridoxamine 5'-phosphate oxidase family protein n=1 Tax=Parasalinivibrio latis TaxID=2952610 RepID=UPI0030E2A186